MESLVIEFKWTSRMRGLIRCRVGSRRVKISWKNSNMRDLHRRPSLRIRMKLWLTKKELQRR